MSAIESYIADLTSQTATLQQSRAAAIEAWHETLRRLKALESRMTPTEKEAEARRFGAQMFDDATISRQRVSVLEARNAELEARSLALVQESEGLKARVKELIASQAEILANSDTINTKALRVMANADRDKHRRTYLLGATITAIGDAYIVPDVVIEAVAAALAEVTREHSRSPMVVADCGNHRRGPCAMGRGVLCQPCREAMENREVPRRATAALAGDIARLNSPR